MEATAELLDDLKTGGGLVIFAINAAGAPVGLPGAARWLRAVLCRAARRPRSIARRARSLMQQIAQRQQEMMEEHKKQQAAKARWCHRFSAAGAAPPAAAPPAKK